MSKIPKILQTSYVHGPKGKALPYFNVCCADVTSLYVSKFLFLIAVSGLAREEVALPVAVTVKIKRALPQIELSCRGERDPFMMKLTC